jgi:hypothetical protein
MISTHTRREIGLPSLRPPERAGDGGQKTGQHVPTSDQVDGHARKKAAVSPPTA